MAFCEKHGFKTVTSVSNKFMVDTKRPAQDVINDMRKEMVYIGRPWPVWPTSVRVTIGTKDEMEKFKTAFLKVLA
jgi:histidinol-phosphate/aromatic aminotransferase/cobyric acid decarboxylase-like protein